MKNNFYEKLDLELVKVSELDIVSTSPFDGEEEEIDTPIIPQAPSTSSNTTSYPVY